MPLTLTVNTAPSEEPVSRDEAKRYARITLTAEDSIVDSLITAARKYVETVTRRQLVTATWDLQLDGFPSGEIVVPRPPLQSVGSITYTDENGNTGQTWSSANYQTDTDSEPGRVRPVEGETYPNTQQDTYNTVKVTYDAGYGAASAVPEDFKTAIKMMVLHWCDIGRAPVADIRAADVPMTVDALLMQHRIWMF